MKSDFPQKSRRGDLFEARIRTKISTKRLDYR